MSFFPSPPLFLHPSTNWNQPQADPQLSDSFVVVDGQYEAGAPVRPSESSSAAASALQSCAERARAAKMVAKPSAEHAVLECPRCKSTNTKFCYYNNYSRTQPRHLCKTCRRHWTHGGALRNVPVGGGTRRSNKKAAKHSKPETATANYRSSSSLSVPSSRRLPQQIDNDDGNDNQNHTVIHNFGFVQQLPGVGMAAPQPCPNLYTTFREENVGATVKKMEEIGYVPRVQISYDPSNNDYNDMFLWGGSGSNNCIAWPSGSRTTTGFSYGSSSPHHITFMDSDHMP